METTLWSLAGLVGVAFYLSAYAGLQLGLLRGSSVTYTVLNLIAASLVALSLIDAFNLSSFLTQMSWIVLSVIGLIRLAWSRKTTRFTAEERRFLNAHFNTLAPQLGRKLLGLGTWQTISPGTILTRQGTPLHELVYLASGAADVRAHGALVAQLGPEALIGELTVIHGSEATADVEVTQETRIFALPRAVLIRELEMDHEFALAVSNALQVEAQRKIEASNRDRAGLAVSR